MATLKILSKDGYCRFFGLLLCLVGFWGEKAQAGCVVSFEKGPRKAWAAPVDQKGKVKGSQTVTYTPIELFAPTTTGSLDQERALARDIERLKEKLGQRQAEQDAQHKKRMEAWRRAYEQTIQPVSPTNAFQQAVTAAMLARKEDSLQLPDNQQSASATTSMESLEDTVDTMHLDDDGGHTPLPTAALAILVHKDPTMPKPKIAWVN